MVSSVQNDYPELFLKIGDFFLEFRISPRIAESSKDVNGEYVLDYKWRS
jgi:hypothetical protein